MYRACVYFHGPLTEWNAAGCAGQIPAAEIIAEFTAPWLWLARSHVRNALKPLNAGRCGYVIERNGKPVEVREAVYRGPDQ